MASLLTITNNLEPWLLRKNLRHRRKTKKLTLFDQNIFNSNNNNNNNINNKSRNEGPSSRFTYCISGNNKWTSTAKDRKRMPENIGSKENLTSKDILIKYIKFCKVDCSKWKLTLQDLNMTTIESIMSRWQLFHHYHHNHHDHDHDNGQYHYHYHYSGNCYSNWKKYFRWGDLVTFQVNLNKALTYLLKRQTTIMIVKARTSKQQTATNSTACNHHLFLRWWTSFAMSTSLSVWWNKQTDTYMRITFFCCSLAHKQDSFPQNVHSQATIEWRKLKAS